MFLTRYLFLFCFFFFSSRRRHTRCGRDWSSDVCSSDLPIEHSPDRMEFIFVTFFPEEKKSYFIISYFEEDKNLYQNLGRQLVRRNNLKSDITMLIASHVENIYFNPIYYDTFIKEHEDKFEDILIQSQMDIATVNKDNQISESFSITPPNYLNNEFEINYFGY